MVTGSRAGVASTLARLFLVRRLSAPVGVFAASMPHAAFKRSNRARMSSAFHATVRGPSRTGLGYFPDLTPSSQDVRLTGIIAGIGGLAFGFPIICRSRIRPVSGSALVAIVAPCWALLNNGFPIIGDTFQKKTLSKKYPPTFLFRALLACQHQPPAFGGF